MEQTALWNLLVVVFFIGSLLSIALSVLYKEIFLLVAIASFLVFLLSAAKRDNLVSENLEALGCEYIGDGKKGQPHMPATRFYMCSDGVIRSD